MSLSNGERIYKALEELRSGLSPFVVQTLKSRLGESWPSDICTILRDTTSIPLREDQSIGDIAIILKILKAGFKDFFEETLGYENRKYVFEASDYRNEFAHQKNFSTDDTWRALDTFQRLLEAVGAGTSRDQIARIKDGLFNVSMREKIRTVERKSLKSEALPGIGALPGWRQIISPQIDVINGEFTQAEFAADLDKVFKGDAREEYQDPYEFYRRTYITRGMDTILTTALKRLQKKGGDPVIELQTRFGGGKTHTMIALYHLASPGAELNRFNELEEILQKTGTTTLPKVHRAVITGNNFSPNQTYSTPDGLKIRTLWGVLAWQLGGIPGYEMVKGSDEASTAPGKNVLEELLTRFSPNLILMDELVSYYRQLSDDKTAIGGSFDAATTFFQSLAEAVRNTEGSLLIASLPASDIEVGGDRGLHALDTLKNILRRIHVTWSPAAEDESYEIIRRRLFKAIEDNTSIGSRDAVIKKFHQYYKENPKSFPRQASAEEYLEIMARCYPIHPDVFEQLYRKWSSIDRFQQTRGVLRFMANVIHILWTSEDASPLIQPGNLPFYEQKVRDNLLSYVDANWAPVFDQDVDSPEATSRKVDRENTSFGKSHLARRTARTILLGSAPISQNRGLDLKEISLGTLTPDLPPNFVRDALNQLQQNASYLYPENDHFYFDSKASLNRTAKNLAEAMREDDVEFQILKILKELTEKGQSGFAAIQVLTPSTEVPDEMKLRLILLPPSVTHSKGASTAKERAEKILNSRGSTHRDFKNMLIFLAATTASITEIQKEVRERMAWEKILEERTERDLTESQSSTADRRIEQLKSTINTHITDGWNQLLYPEEDLQNPGSHNWLSNTTSTGANLAEKAYRTLRDEGLATEVLSFKILIRDLESYNLDRGEKSISLQRLHEDHCRFLYLKRLKNERVLTDSIASYYQSPVSGFSWYYAARKNPDGSFDGIKTHFGSPIQAELNGYLIHESLIPTPKEAPQEAPNPTLQESPPVQEGPPKPWQPKTPEPDSKPQPTEAPKKSFRVVFKPKPGDHYAQIRKINEEIIQTLLDAGSSIQIHFEIEADHSGKGFTESQKRTLTENSHQLGCEDEPDWY